MKQNSTLTISFFALLSFTILFSSCSQKESWPKFLGSSSMIVTGEDYPTEWDDNTNIKWTYDMTGESWSSPIIWGDKVFITSAYTEDEKEAPQATPPQQSGGNPQEGQTPPQGNGQVPETSQENDIIEEVYKMEVTCIDLETGEEIWRKIAFEGNPRKKKHANGTYANETPTTDGERVYAYFGMTGIYCYDMDGELLWQNDLGAFDTEKEWGTGSSPVLHDGMLYIQVDNNESSFIAALETESGQLVWKSAREESTNYSSPVVWENSLRKELVTTGKKARSYNLKTGDIFWEIELDGGYSIPSPLAYNDIIYIGNVNEMRSPSTLYAIKAGAEGEITDSDIAWSVSKSGMGSPTPLVYNDYLYLLSSRNGEVTCYNASTGDKVYEEKVSDVGTSWASPWLYNDVIYFTDDKGVTHTFKAGPDFEELSTYSIDDTVWGTVAAANNTYVIKGVNKIYGISKN